MTKTGIATCRRSAGPFQVCRKSTVHKSTCFPQCHRQSPPPPPPPPSSFPFPPSTTSSSTAEVHSPTPPSTHPVSLMVPPFPPHLSPYSSSQPAPRPAPNYVFGDSPSALLPEPSSKQIRKLLRSPSPDHVLDPTKPTPRPNRLSSMSLSPSRTLAHLSPQETPQQTQTTTTPPAHSYANSTTATTAPVATPSR